MAAQNRQEIMQELQGIFRKLFDDDDIVLTDATTANDIEDWDSFEQINLIVLIEKHFKIKFAMNEVVEARNVGDMVLLIEGKLA